MIFIYSFDGIFKEIVADDQCINKDYFNNYLIISDDNCSTRKEFEQKYSFDSESKTFTINNPSPISTEQEILETIEAAKQTLIKEINDYASNKLLYGTSVADEIVLSATDESLMSLYLIREAINFGASGPFYIQDINDNILPIIDAEILKEYFITLMAFKNSVVSWKMRSVQEVKKLTTLPMIESFKELILFI